MEDDRLNTHRTSEEQLENPGARGKRSRGVHAVRKETRIMGTVSPRKPEYFSPTVFSTGRTITAEKRAETTGGNSAGTHEGNLLDPKQQILQMIQKLPQSKRETTLNAVLRELDSERNTQSPTPSISYVKPLYRTDPSMIAAMETLQASLSVLEHEKIQSDLAKAQAEQESNRLSSKLEGLQKLHVHSVNRLSPGIEPISDQIFKERFTHYHAKTYQWSRKYFKGRSLRDYYYKLPKRARLDFVGAIDLKLPRVVDHILWNFLNHEVIKPWFPIDIPTGTDCNWEDIEAWFLKTDVTDSDQHRIDFWRSYTASLAFQSRNFQPAIAAQAENVLSRCLNYLRFFMDDPTQIGQEHEGALGTIFHTVLLTTAEMKCQPGNYTLEIVPVGTQYNENNMVAEDEPDLYNDDEETEKIVLFVLSDGVVKKRYRGSEELVERICKPRVLIGKGDVDMIEGHVAEE